MTAGVLRAVLFDLDGTLHDRPRTVRRYLEGHVRRFSLPDGYTERWTELDDFGYRPKAEVFALLVQEFGLKHAPATLLQDFSDHAWAACQRTPHTLEVLNTLRQSGLKLGLVTNGPSDKQRQCLSGLGLDDAFDAVLISEELGFGKPDPRIYAAALDALRLPPSQVLFVGDSPRNDVAGPQAAGLRAAWLPTSHPLPQDVTPDVVLDDLPHLLKLLPGATGGRLGPRHP